MGNITVINIENVNFNQLPQQAGEIVELRAAPAGNEAPAEYSEWERRIWRRGYESAQRPAEKRATQTREYRTLGNGEPITQKQALKELDELGDGWRLETPAELYGLVDYGHKNQHDAYTRDETLRASAYWTSQETPWYEGGRVVVGFYYGNVNYDDDVRARARAVRVSGQ